MFANIRWHGLKWNTEKCVFGVRRGNVTSRLPEAGAAYIWQLSRTQTILTDQHMSFLHTLTSLVRTRE